MMLSLIIFEALNAFFPYKWLYCHSTFDSLGSGVIYTCGLGSNGQLGQGVEVFEESLLKPLTDVEDQRFICIDAGDNHSAAISSKISIIFIDW